MVVDYKNFEEMLNKQWYKKERVEILIETEYAIGVVYKFFNSCSRIYVKVPNGLIEYEYYPTTITQEEQDKINKEIIEKVSSINKEKRNQIYNEYLNERIEYENETIKERNNKIDKLIKANEKTMNFIKELEKSML